MAAPTTSSSPRSSSAAPQPLFVDDVPSQRDPRLPRVAAARGQHGSTARAPHSATVRGYVTFTVIPLASVTALVALRQGYETIAAGNLYLMAFVAGAANLPMVARLQRRDTLWAQLLLVAQLMLMVGGLLLWWDLSAGDRNPFQRADSWPWLAALFVAATIMVTVVALVAVTEAAVSATGRAGAARDG